jgi:hypothetical protein
MNQTESIKVIEGQPIVFFQVLAPAQRMLDDNN